MCRRLAALGAAYVHGAGLELDRRPLQAAELGHPQTVPEADQDHGCVALTVAIALGRLDQALDLELVRCSRSRPMSRLLRRWSVTVRKSESGATSRRFDFVMISAPARKLTGRNLRRLRTVGKHLGPP
jgi:hypothetical protein